jgi:hypothetical protein
VFWFLASHSTLFGNPIVFCSTSKHQLDKPHIGEEAETRYEELLHEQPRDTEPFKQEDGAI